MNSTSSKGIELVGPPALIRADDRSWVQSEIVWYAVSRAIPGALSFATVILLVRSLGVQQYGYLAITQAAANGASVVASGWLTQGLLRFLPTSGHRGGGIERTVFLSSAIALALGIGLTTAILLALGQPWSGWHSLALGALLATGFSAHAVVSSILQAGIMPRRVAEMETIRSVTAFAFAAAACAGLAANFLGGIAALGVSMVLSAAWGLHRIARADAPDAVRSRPPAAPELRQLVSFGAPMSAWLGLSLAFPLVDRTVIERSLGAEAVGTYSAIYDVSFRTCAFLLMPVVLALHPRMMRARHEEGAAGVRRLLFLGLKLQAAISVGLMLLVSLGAPLLLGLSVGDVGLDVRATIVPLSAAACVWHIALIAHKPLEAELRTTALLVLMLFSLLIGLAGNLALVPELGLPAAAWSSLAAATFYALGAAVLGTAERSWRMRP